MPAVWSRRAFVFALPAVAGAQGIASEQKKYRDPATELELTRLTDPQLSNSYLPPPSHRAVGRNNSLLYCSDRTGSMQAFRMDLKSGQSRQFSTAAALDPSTVQLLPDDKSICFCDGDTVVIAGSRTRTVYSSGDGWQRAGAFGVSEDGQHALVSEQKGGRYRVRIVTLARNSAATIAESEKPVTILSTRPKRAGVLYGSEDGLWLVNYDGQQNRKLKTGSGLIRAALWSADGRSIFYIHQPGGRALNEMRECISDLNEDKFIAATSQFVSFTRNADASVFVGVSGSKASPYILLLLRAARRELTVAEHRASDPKAVSVQFSQNSQRIFYQTDREGKPAIYSMVLDKFVENTELTNVATEPSLTQPLASSRALPLDA
jgi:oligogalacturonide lyase